MNETVQSYPPSFIKLLDPMRKKNMLCNLGVFFFVYLTMHHFFEAHYSRRKRQKKKQHIRPMSKPLQHITSGWPVHY